MANTPAQMRAARLSGRSLPLLLGAVFVLSAGLRAPSHAQHLDHQHGAMSVGQVHHLHGDSKAYIASLEATNRDAWQKPQALLQALALRPDQRVADIGCGPGYFTRRLARLLTGGWIYAVDVEPAMLQALQAHLREDGLDRVTPVLAALQDPQLPPASVDLALIVDTYHHLADRTQYLRRLARSLRPGGRIAIVDFHKRPLPLGPPPEMKLTPEQVEADARAAGLVTRPGPPADLLPYQYVLILAAPEPGNGASRQ